MLVLTGATGSVAAVTVTQENIVTDQKERNRRMCLFTEAEIDSAARDDATWVVYL